MCYRSFIANISKPTSVRGLLPVLSNEPLAFLADYCRRQLNLRDHSEQQKLSAVMSSLPALWPDLDAICNHEKCVFLPIPVSTIVLRILQIR